MTLISDLFEIRSRGKFSANDITIWLVKTLNELFGISVTQIHTEVIIKGKSKGRADVVVQDSVGIETKRNLSDELSDAEVQVKRILEKLEQEGDLSPIGIATDGQFWKFYVLAEEKPFLVFSFNLKETTKDKELEKMLWEGLSTFRHLKDRPDPTAEAIAELFRTSGPVFNEVRSQLVASIKYLLRNKPVDFDSKFVPWFELFSYVYNNFDKRCLGWSNHGNDLNQVIRAFRAQNTVDIDRKIITGAVELFIRHTYLAMLARALSSLVTLGEDEVAKILVTNPSSIITGKALANCGISISDDNDFFIWPSNYPQIGKMASAILRALQRFSDNYTDDVFRHLYENIVDPETRHELGEFFTPKWMAQLIVEETITDPAFKILDPACGSGTFLVFALRKKIDILSKKQKIKSLDVINMLNDVWGIDVNPLSVTLARTNLYLTAVNLLKGQEQPSEFYLRIYVADTFILPRFKDQEQRQLGEKGGSPIISAPVTPNISIPILSRLTPDEAIHWIEYIGRQFERNGGTSNIVLKKDPKDLADFQRSLIIAMKTLRKKIWG